MLHFVSPNNCCAVILWTNSSIKRGREAHTAQGEFLFYIASFVETLNPAGESGRQSYFRDRSLQMPYSETGAMDLVLGIWSPHSVISERGRLGTEVLLVAMLTVTLVTGTEPCGWPGSRVLPEHSCQASPSDPC